MAYVLILLGLLFGAGSLFFFYWTSPPTKAQAALGIPSGGLALLLIPYGFHLLAKPRQMLQGRLDAARIDPQKPIFVNFGSNILQTDYNQVSTRGIDLRRFINVGFEYPLKIRLEQARMLVSAFLTDAQGRMVAQIVDNEWQINPDNHYDRNFDNNALEVIDKQRIPALQIVLSEENAVYIGGVFNFPSGRAVVTPNGFLWNPSEDQIQEYIRRIFIYPGDKNLGKRAP